MYNEEYITIEDHRIRIYTPKDFPTFEHKLICQIIVLMLKKWDSNTSFTELIYENNSYNIHLKNSEFSNMKHRIEEVLNMIFAFNMFHVHYV